MERRQSNIRPVRGITADTVRALLNLRHAGSDCTYLPLERGALVDQVKGTLPVPSITPSVAQPIPLPDCDDEARSAGPTEPTAPANSKRKPLSSLAADPIAERREALDRAIRFLKTKCVLVDVSDRTALVRKYRVSGQRYLMLAEHVIEHAQALGMEITHP